jgi:hypothetical protein
MVAAESVKSVKGSPAKDDDRLKILKKVQEES